MSHAKTVANGLDAGNVNPREAAAVQEAGHCVVALALGGSTRGAYINANGTGRAYARSGKGGLGEIAVSLAGVAAEALFCGEVPPPGGRDTAGDFANVARMLGRHCPTGDAIGLSCVAHLTLAACQLLLQPANRRAVELIAAELVEHGRIGGDRARELFEHAHKKAAAQKSA